jgi:amino acid transporter
VSLVTTAGILSWIVIGLTYLRFYNALRVQHISRDRLPYKSPFQPYITVCDFFFTVWKGLYLSLWSVLWPRYEYACIGIQRLAFIYTYLQDITIPLQLSQLVSYLRNVVRRILIEFCACIFSLIYPVLYFSCKAWLRDTVIPLDAIDFLTEFTVIDNEIHDDTKKSTYDNALNSIF